VTLLLDSLLLTGVLEAFLTPVLILVLLPPLSDLATRSFEFPEVDLLLFLIFETLSFDLVFLRLPDFSMDLPTVLKGLLLMPYTLEALLRIGVFAEDCAYIWLKLIVLYLL